MYQIYIYTCICKEDIVYIIKNNPYVNINIYTYHMCLSYVYINISYIHILNTYHTYTFIKKNIACIKTKQIYIANIFVYYV